MKYLMISMYISYVYMYVNYLNFIVQCDEDIFMIAAKSDNIGLSMA